MNLEEVLKTADKNIKQAHRTADGKVNQAHELIKAVAKDVKNGKSTGNEVFDFLILDNYDQRPGVLLDLIKQTKDFQKQLENHRGQYILAVYEQEHMVESGGLGGLGKYEPMTVKEWGKIAETGNVLLIEPNKDGDKIVRINTNGIYKHTCDQNALYSTADDVFCKKKRSQTTKHNMAYGPLIPSSSECTYAFGKTFLAAESAAEKLAEKNSTRSKYAFADDEEDY